MRVILMPLEPLGVVLGGFMQGENRQRWEELCEQAATERSPNRLTELLAELNRLLEEKRNRRNGEDPDSTSISPAK